MKRFFHLITILGFLMLLAQGFPAYAGAQIGNKQANISQLQTQPSPEMGQTSVAPSPTKGGDLNILAFIFSLFVPVASLWKVFTKAGIKGWWSLIPIGNSVMFMKMINKPWYHLFLLLIPFYNLYLLVVWNMDLAEKFGKSRSFGWGLALLWPIFLGILAWKKSLSFKG